MKEIISDQSQLKILIDAERERIRDLAFVELDWWQSLLIEKDEDLQGLIEIPTIGENYQVIWKLRNGEEPRLLTSQAYCLLLHVAALWKNDLREKGIQKTSVLLSITSLFRSKSLQEKYLNSGSMAALVSSHQAGTTFDIDPNGFYDLDTLKPINKHSDIFDNAWNQTLKKVLKEIAAAGYCNFVLERNYKNENVTNILYESCYHVCVSPDYLKDERN